MTTAALPSPRFTSHSRRVLAGGFVGSFASVGLSLYLFGVFQDSIVEAFGISVGTYSWGPSIFSLVSAVLSPIMGRSLRTHGREGLSIRGVMITGAVALGIGLVLISRSDSVLLLAVGFGLLVAPATTLMGPLMGQAMATNWFEAKRGRALGIVAAGTTIGGVFTPPLAASLIEALGWRDAMSLLGILMFVIPLPIIAFCVTTSPEDIGERPDGVTAPPLSADGSPRTIAPPKTTGALLREPNLWLLGLAFGLIFSSGTISVVFTVPYASQLGLPLVGGAAIVSIRSAAAATGKVVLGSLSDRFGVKPVLWGIIAAEMVGIALLVQTRDPLVFALLGVAIGFVGGAALPLQGALVGLIFGRASFPSALGLLSPVSLPFRIFLVPVAGYVYNATNDYAMVFGCMIPIFALAALLLFFIHPPEDDETNGAAQDERRSA
jgi:MFS family permease